jgi:hypothetical protein
MLAEKLENFNNNNIIINDPIKNSVMQYNYFCKLMYSNEFITFNSIFAVFNLDNADNVVIDNDKILFNNKNNNNNVVLNNLVKLENYILNFFYTDKTKVYKIRELIDLNYFKFSTNDTNNNLNSEILNKQNKYYFIIKISGIWESKENIGLTFKFILINKVYNF